MRLKLIQPGRLPFYSSGERRPLWYPSLWLPMVAAVTPESWEIEIVEGQAARSIDFDEGVDLVGVSVLTVHAQLAYEVADAYRERGVKTVLGGVHCTGLPGECKQHADAVVIGEAENVWGEVLNDFKKGDLKTFYRSDETVDVADLPLPRVDLLDNSEYAHAHVVMPTRGCPVGCAFCVVPEYQGAKYRTQPVARVVEEVEWARKNRGSDIPIMFPVNMLSYKAYALELADALRPLELSWNAAGYLPHLLDESFLESLKEAGCYSIYAETEMVSKHKEPKLFQAYAEAARMLRDRGLELIVNFTLGYDNDDKSVFSETWEFVEKNNLSRLAVQLLVPWPGTQLFERLQAEGRIIDFDWSHYDNSRVVFEPQLMSVEELQEGYLELLQAIRRRVATRVRSRRFGAIRHI